VIPQCSQLPSKYLFTYTNIADIRGKNHRKVEQNK
jgi:hypothetical protein